MGSEFNQGKSIVKKKLVLCVAIAQIKIRLLFFVVVSSAL
jgi:hypothetical protein